MARAMKDSGIEWIGEIPEGWETVRFKYLHDGLNTGEAIDKEFWTNEESDKPFYTAGLVPIKTSYKDFPPSKYTSDNDLLLARNGTPYVYFPVSGACYTDHIIRAAIKPKMNRRFIQYAVQQSIMSIVVDSVSIATWSASLWNEQAIPWPPVEAQQRIVGFLDAECARIDAVIEQTRASIEEYKKLKQSVITEAVTKGIRPGRKMKDSGVEWIGVVPEEWVVTKLKYFSSIRSGITLGKTYSRDTKLVEYPYLRVANVQGSYTDLTDVATILITEEEAEKYRLHDGELLMTEGGDRDKLGRGTVWHAEIDLCLHQNHVFALTTNDDLSAEYVSFLSASFVGRDYFDVTANQSVHLASTNSTTIMNFTIPVPKIEEQNEIVSYLFEKTEELEKLIAKKQALISDLESYKKSLIFEYVTGKKEVM